MTSNDDGSFSGYDLPFDFAWSDPPYTTNDQLQPPLQPHPSFIPAHRPQARSARPDDFPPHIPHDPSTSNVNYGYPTNAPLSYGVAPQAGPSSFRRDPPAGPHLVPISVAIQSVEALFSDAEGGLRSAKDSVHHLERSFERSLDELRDRCMSTIHQLWGQASSHGQHPVAENTPVDVTGIGIGHIPPVYAPVPVQPRPPQPQGEYFQPPPNDAPQNDADGPSSDSSSTDSPIDEAYEQMGRHTPPLSLSHLNSPTRAPTELLEQADERFIEIYMSLLNQNKTMNMMVKQLTEEGKRVQVKEQRAKQGVVPVTSSNLLKKEQADLLEEKARAVKMWAENCERHQNMEDRLISAMEFNARHEELLEEERARIREEKKALIAQAREAGMKHEVSSLSDTLAETEVVEEQGCDLGLQGLHNTTLHRIPSFEDLGDFCQTRHPLGKEAFSRLKSDETYLEPPNQPQITGSETSSARSASPSSESGSSSGHQQSISPAA